MYISQPNTDLRASALSSSAYFDTAVAHQSQNMPTRTAALQAQAHNPASVNTSGTSTPVPAYSGLETPAPAYLSPAPAYSSGTATPAHAPEGSRDTDIELNAVEPEAAPVSTLPNEADLERGQPNTAHSAALATAPREQLSLKKPLIKLAISAGLMGAGIYGVVNGVQRITRG